MAAGMIEPRRRRPPFQQRLGRAATFLAATWRTSARDWSSSRSSARRCIFPASPTRRGPPCRRNGTMLARPTGTATLAVTQLPQLLPRLFLACMVPPPSRRPHFLQVPRSLRVHHRLRRPPFRFTPAAASALPPRQWGIQRPHRRTPRRPPRARRNSATGCCLVSTTPPRSRSSIADTHRPILLLLVCFSRGLLPSEEPRCIVVCERCARPTTCPPSPPIIGLLNEAGKLCQSVFYSLF